MITVFVADDHKAFRQYIRDLLNDVSCIDVVGEADNGKVALELVHELKPDIVFMDVRMPVMNGIEATRLIKSECPHTKVIAFSTYHEKAIIDQVLDAGASGYLLKGEGLNQIIAAIKAAITDQTFTSQEVRR